MEAQITITLKASGSQVQRLLTLFGLDGENVGTRADSEHPGREAISRFLINLSPNGRQVIEAISAHSAEGERVYRDDLARELDTDLGRLNGYLGGVGKWSSRGFGSDKPFAGKRDAAGQDVYYQIDAEVAALILGELPHVPNIS